MTNAKISPYTCLIILTILYTVRIWSRIVLLWNMIPSVPQNPMLSILMVALFELNHILGNLLRDAGETMHWWGNKWLAWGRKGRRGRRRVCQWLQHHCSRTLSKKALSNQQSEAVPLIFTCSKKSLKHIHFKMVKMMNFVLCEFHLNNQNLYYDVKFANLKTNST